MSNQLLYPSKAHRFNFCRFTCQSCKLEQIIVVAIGGKRCKCVDCKTIHVIASTEIRNSLNEG
jgi:Zn-finger protein